MSAEAISKRLNYIFMLCLFSGLIGLVQTIFTSLNAHRFTGIPLLSILITTEGVILWFAFKLDSLDKALNQLSTLKIIALVLAAYSTYSLIMNFVRMWGNYAASIATWLQSVSNVSATLASLAVFFTATTLKIGDTKKFNTASAVILIVEVVLVLFDTVLFLVLTDMLAPILIGIVAFIFCFSVMPKLLGKLLGNKIIRGAIIGGIIAGDVGAVVGAIVASNSKEKK